ncbi:MAG: helix-hairpin-helix domain-containing protein [Clostridium sp.]|nr:helix-hairpin-helix domain-containing protein [Clostridium sp.]
MKKRIKITAAVFAVVFCTLLGCERKEKEAGEFLLPAESEEGLPADSEGLIAASGQEKTALESTDDAAQSDSQAETTSTGQQGASTGQQAQANTGIQTTGSLAENNNTCVVHVCGAVKEPGVYKMDADSRIYQAIEKAGGFMQEADENYLNQADLLSDGMKIYVPTKEEVENADGGIEWKTGGGAEQGKEQEQTRGQGQGQEEVPSEGAFPVNINTAGEAQLCTLPGVGSSKAKSIIAYREKNGAYQKIEDIMNVEGIKDGVFQKIKDSITV